MASNEQADPQARCDARTSAGEPCRARPRPGSRWCQFHDPDQADVQAQAKVKGGLARSRPPATLPPDTPPPPCTTPDEIGKMLAETVAQVRTGAIDHRIANSIGVLSGHLLRAWELGALARDVAEMERRMEVIVARRNGSVSDADVNAYLQLRAEFDRRMEQADVDRPSVKPPEPAEDAEALLGNAARVLELEGGNP